MAVAPSKLAVASEAPPGDQLTDRMVLVWVHSSTTLQLQPLAASPHSHNRTVLSPLQLARVRPAGMLVSCTGWLWACGPAAVAVHTAVEALGLRAGAAAAAAVLGRLVEWQTQLGAHRQATRRRARLCPCGHPDTGSRQGTLQGETSRSAAAWWSLSLTEEAARFSAVSLGQTLKHMYSTSRGARQGKCAAAAVVVGRVQACSGSCRQWLEDSKAISHHARHGRHARGLVTQSQHTISL